MKKNYNLLPKNPQNLLWRLGGNEHPDEGSPPPVFVKKSSLLITAMLFMFATAQSFAQTSYCTPAPTSVDNQGIINVTIGSINNTTVAEAGRYGDYSAQIVNVGQTVTQPFSITFGTGYTYDTKIWVDWNNDFDFDDEGEQVYFGTSNNANPTTLSGSFTVPATASLGNHRVRIGGLDDGGTAGIRVTPCYTGTYGSYEDYTINVTVPPACFTPANAAAVVTAANNANLSWAAPTQGTTPVGYEYAVDTNLAAPASGTAVTTTSVTGYTGFADNTNYYLHVRTNCGEGSYSDWVTSPAFRYIGGDTCANAISLDTLTSPLSSTTAGAANDYTASCNFSSAQTPDLFYSIVVPAGYKLSIGQTANNYDSVHSAFYGTCESNTQLVCYDYPELPADGAAATLVWENTTGSTQTVYWVQDSYNAAGGTFTLAWTLTPPPACNIPTAVTAQLVSATQANLSWGVPVTGTPTGYQYAVTTTATAPESGTATTATSVAGVTVTANQTNYLHVRTACGDSGFSTWVTYAFFAGYCTPAPTSVDNQGIINVTIGTINNTTVAEPGRYGDYTAQIVNVGQGVTQPFSITLGTGYTYDTRMWIDWNDDLDFNDEGEQVFSTESSNANPVTLTGSFTVPANAILGNHRIRIGGQDNGPTTPCYTGSYGTFEDYTINVTLPPACFTPANALGVATASGLANLSWTAPTLGTTPTGYEYVVDTVATAPTVAGTTVTATTVTGYTGIVDGTFYYLHVRTNCGGGNYSEWITSAAFRYLPGDTCATAISLDALTSPLSSTTVGAGNDYAPTCSFSNAADLLYSITVPVGYTLSIGQTANNYDTVHSAFYGTCENRTVLTCADYPELPSEGAAATLVWENTTSATQTVYWVQDGYGSATGTFTLGWTLTPPPACNVPTAVSAVLTNTTTATVSWAGPITGTAAGYEYAVTNNATPPATGTATTETSITGIPVTLNIYSYLHVRTACGETGFSEWVTFRFYSGYCIPAPTSVDGIGITNVTIGSINNTTVAEANNYGNYSDQIVNVGQGVTQPFSITFSTGYTYDTKIWVDWNNDLDFDDEGEQIFFGTSLAPNPSTLSGTFTVPATATLGQHRLRIGGLDFGDTNGINVTPCYTGSYGSYEDYTINVTTPPVCFTPTAPTAVNASAGFVNISWTAPTLGGTPAGYEYVVDTTVGAPTVSGTATTETSVANVVAPVNVRGYLHVRTNCGNGDYSEWVTTSFYNGVCIPAPTSVDGLGITNVAIGSINNATGSEPGRYGDYSSQIVNVGQGVTQAFEITYSTGYTYDTKIWVDWNDDLDFDDAGEQVYFGTSLAANPTILAGTFTVPATAALGPHRLRIGGLDFGDTNGVNVTPCYTGTYGSYEDYTINVTTPPSCFTPTNAVGAATASNTANLSWTAPTLGGTPVGYEYVVDTFAAAPATAGTASATTTVTGYTGIVDNTYYYLHVRTNCGEGDFSEWITSPRFRFLLGDTCLTAVSLDGQTSPYSSTTVGAGNDYTPTCSFSNAPELFYSLTVPNGYTVTIGLTANGYDSVHSVFYGSCASQTALDCTDTEIVNTVWENVTGSSQTLYWVQDGYGSNSGTFTLAWSLVPPVTCDKPRALAVQLTSLTTANLSWTVPNTGSPEGYEYAITSSETPPASGTFNATTTVTNVTVTPNVAQYLHVRSACGTTDGFSVWVTIPFFSGYCVPTNTVSTAYYITGVTTTGGSTNIASTSTAFSAFTDYTATQTVSNYAGESFNVQVTAPTTTDQYLYSVWVDWNNDFDFDDLGERVINTGYLFSPANIGTVTIPVGTPVGTYRMRIRNAHTGSPVPACGEQGSGEAEDYTLVVEATPSCVAPFGLSITPTDPGFANLSWSPSLLGGAPLGYEYAFGTSSTPPAGNGTPSASFFVGDAPYNPAVSVYLFVRTVCGEGDYSEWATFSVLDLVSPELLSNSVIVYKDGNTINVTSGTTQVTGVTIYDTRGRKLYDQAANSNNVVINDLQIQQQVIILEINTTKGKVSKRIIF
ncbi:hypothetical protein Q765_19125 [Flavobacterium rivuli WB 3.3-2 = DSM 21788]|uniref:Fibronectin type-III domain-containing protein n=1 Tax=Flavobacterium rivuli WB 3.3-2 = DSM 21788 TaxID=1121895 RepID=A0A0A2LZW1_9FLAO|nr:GEVED domain-containing protein [Flavobacterium rivuli]KGO84881.1 hypothetical protein Q765_19125 [Flavobacterium rivuli WB 3.3-2 = DSM 21788]